MITNAYYISKTNKHFKMGKKKQKEKEANDLNVASHLHQIEHLLVLLVVQRMVQVLSIWFVYALLVD